MKEGFDLVTGCVSTLMVKCVDIKWAVAVHVCLDEPLLFTNYKAFVGV